MKHELTNLAPVPQKHAALHVLFIVDQLLLPLGGGERALLQYIRRLPRDRFRVSLVTFAADVDWWRAQDLDCAFHLLPLRSSYDWNALRQARRLRNIISDESVDIVHTLFTTSDLYGAAVARMSGAPVVISNRRDMGILRLAKHEWMYRRMASRYDHVLAVSEEVKKYCVEHDGVAPARISTLYNAVALPPKTDAGARLAARDALHLPLADPIVAMVGNIRRVKGFDLFIETAAQVRNKIGNVRFLIAGAVLEPDHFSALQRRVSELRLEETVKFLGPVEPVSELLRAADVFALLSRSEGLSNALIEAMAHGLPCVAADVGGNRECIQDGASGYIVAPEDTSAAAERITRLLGDTKLSARLGGAAREVAHNKFSFDSMIKQLVSTYESLVRSKQ